MLCAQNATIHLFRARKRAIAVADDIEVPEVKIGCEPGIGHVSIMKGRWPKLLLCPARMETRTAENIAVRAGQPWRCRCQPR